MAEFFQFDQYLSTLVSQNQQMLQAIEQLTTLLSSQGIRQSYTAASGAVAAPGTLPVATNGSSTISLNETVNVSSSGITVADLISALRNHTRGDIKEDNWQVAAQANGGQAVFQVQNLQGQAPILLASSLATYQNAELIFTTGVNLGVRSTIASVSTSNAVTQITLNDNLPQTANQGDRFLVIRPVAASTDLFPLALIDNQGAGTNFAVFTAPYSGTATVQISLATASVLNLSATPAGGSTALVSALESDASVPAGQWQTIQFAMSAGAKYALQVATAQTGNLAVSIEGTME